MSINTWVYWSNFSLLRGVTEKYQTELVTSWSNHAQKSESIFHKGQTMNLFQGDSRFKVKNRLIMLKTYRKLLLGGFAFLEK